MSCRFKISGGDGRKNDNTQTFIGESSITMSNKFLGEGSYGCVYLPGIDCKGKKNKKKTVSKIQIIDFFSKNEVTNGLFIKKNISGYNKFFSPVIKYCPIKFNKLKNSNLDLKKCDVLFEEYFHNKDYYKDYYNTDGENSSLNKLVDAEYFLTHIKYIKNKTLKEYFNDSDNPSVFINNFLSFNMYLLHSISLLNKHNITHNDLHVNNILVDLKKRVPKIIDFGLSFLNKKCYKIGREFDLYFIKKFFMDYRTDNYNHNIEKRFISFVIYNKSEKFYSIVETNNVTNILTNKTIDIFIDDCIDSIVNNHEIAYFFDPNELSYYRDAFKQFYYNFSNKNKYKSYSDILNQLLENVFMFEDLYKLTIDFIYIYFYNKDFIENNKYLHNICKFFIQLMKKVLHPDPEKRFTINETSLVLKFILKYINDLNIHDEKYIGNFMISFDAFLKYNNISHEIAFYKKFAFLDFNLIMKKDILEFIKKCNISI